MLKIRKILVSSMLLAWSMAPMLAAENIARLSVFYDRQTGLLTVDVDRTPLTQITTQSGVEIIVDPWIEKEISISLPERPLEKALKQIARGLGYAMHYDVAGSKLVAMKILPQGKQDSGHLSPASFRRPGGACRWTGGWRLRDWWW